MSETIYKILMVEDDKLDQMAFKRMIEREKPPYEYTMAGSLSEASKVLGEKKFDVIISDYSLGDGTAMDVLALAKETPVILVTGAGDEETAVKVWRAGACDYLTKDAERNYLKTISIAIEKTIRQHELKLALDRKQRNLHAIFDAAPVCMLLLAEDLAIIRVNAAVREKVGKGYLEIIGQMPGNGLGCVNSLADETKQCGLGCNLCSLPKTIKEVFASSKAVHGVEVPLTLMAGADKTVTWFRVNAEPVNIDGRQCAVVAMDDITSRKKAEDAVRESEELYRSLFENMLNGFAYCKMIFDKGKPQDFIYLSVNSTFEVLTGLKNVAGRKVSEVIPGLREFCPELFELYGRVALGGKPEKLEIYVEPLKMWFWISVYCPQKEYFVAVFDVITERKEAEKKLAEAVELKSQFISTVSHELRTPLTCIKEAVEAVLEGVAGDINDRQRHFLDIVKRNMERLGNLINDVLDFQRLESGKSKLDLSESDVRDVIKSVEETMAIIAKHKGLNFAVELDVNLPKMWFDSNKIVQVLTNLVSNSIKFTPQGGSVTVSMLRQGDELVMRVRDTGMGIPKESLSKICDRFYRVPRPGKEIKGTGLGLSIVRKIVDLHRGRMEIESEVDKETTFTIVLPLDARPRCEVLPEQADGILEAGLSDNSVKSH